MHGGAVCIEHHRLCAAQALDFAVRADPKDLIAADGNGLLEPGAATRIDLAVDDDQIDRAARVVALRADDEARDEGRPDDDGNQNGGQARRHFRGYSVASRALLFALQEGRQ